MTNIIKEDVQSMNVKKQQNMRNRSACGLKDKNVDSSHRYHCAQCSDYSFCMTPKCARHRPCHPVVGWWQNTFVEAPKAKVVPSFEATQPLGLHHQPACGTRAHATRWKKVAALEANGEGERMPRPMANSF